ncbi:alpha/beta hydrolase [Alisedimentitalea sp. MJ-SS2]|uniref:alpha/beta hydrolase family protein n=1 Tax=Aliisedimentitalea sp. MJ-SS2 TaxID=3049795 RepID=UPI00290ACBD9|nr:alpha/beta hydrolase [Alisedimentitalea sp. MJ-SS2]MDU8926926.1 alpha/beta hydrolase [Alisedimentitalea sp. MJ-SS2]
MADPSKITPTRLPFAARDGWPMTGDLYVGPNPHIAIVISAGTGYPRHFYRHVAGYLAGQGAVVLTYDYRGIGDSGGGRDLSDSNIDYPDWGRFCVTAALDAIAAQVPGLPVAHLGHSAGGMFLGFTEGHERFVRHAFVSVGTGFIGGHFKHRWPLEMFFWWGFGSYMLLRHGYIRSGRLWRGASLPPKLFRSWRRWSMRRSYIRPELATRYAPNHFDAITAPIRSWVFSDDGIATPQAAGDTLDYYPNAPRDLVLRKPSDYGLTHIGHDSAFRSGREVLWAELWDWLANGTLPDGIGYQA